MPRERNPSREKAKEMYLKSKGKMVLKDIALQLGVLDTQIRKWKSLDKWDNELKGTSKKKKEQSNRSVPNEDVPNKKEIKHEIIIGLENEELTEKQRLFCIHYVKSFNQTLSAIKAGYEPSRAHITGSELVRNSKIIKYIKELKGSISKEMFIDEMDILNKYIKIAFSDISDFVDFGQERVPIITGEGPLVYTNPATGEKEVATQSINSLKLKESYEVDGSLISEIKTSRQGVSVKLLDSLKALDWLSKFFEMNPEHNYRKEFDAKKLELERERFEHVKEMDSIKDW